MWFNKKTANFLGFRVFHFALYPKSKVFLQFLVVYETQDLKTEKMTEDKKTLTL